MAALEQYFSPAQIARAKGIAADAVGKHCKVKTDGFVQHGKIVDCTVSHASINGRRVNIVFSVDMLCGANETRRNFKLLSLPS